MKAKEVNGKIVRGLPKYYKHWAGGFAEQTTEVHEEEGFFDIVIPEFDHDIQKRGEECYFDEKLKIFTYDVVDLPLDLEAIKKQKHEEFDNEIYSEMTPAFMYSVIEKLAFGEPVPQKLLAKIRALRARKTQADAEIDGITDAKEMKKYKLNNAEIELEKKASISARRL